jgi:FkbH-like protein
MSELLFKDLKSNLAKDFSSLPVRRLGLVADSATQFLAKAIRGYGYGENLNLEIFEADFDQIDIQILDPASKLYGSNPNFIILYLAVERLWNQFTATELDQRGAFSDKVLSRIWDWWQAIANHSTAKIIQLNFIELNDGVFGHFSAKTASSFPYQVKKINLGLMEMAQRNKCAFIADIDGLSRTLGYSTGHDPRLYTTSQVAFALDFLPGVSKAIVDIIKAASGNVKKCLILDLDNTLWGGVVGDDGIENIQVGELGMGRAYDSMQRWAKELRHRGIILAVCSKNTEEIAKKPFEHHPDMVLRLSDIAVFVANWDSKLENMKRIQQTLNIGFDSMVFVDDSPFERNMVRELLPSVTVPELPEDPAMYVPYLRSLNLFETMSFSEEDFHRTRQYQEEIARTDSKKSFDSIEDYLKSLDMSSDVKPFDPFSVPRVAQLTQRSNQFNLRTVRYTDADVERIGKSTDYLTFTCDLKDRFGDYGLVGLAILKLLDKDTAFIDTWIMSCRVLKRTMEEFMVNQMAHYARVNGISHLLGEYLPTAKNGIVKDLYSQMGFAASKEQWRLDLTGFRELKTYIANT